MGDARNQLGSTKTLDFQWDEVHSPAATALQECRITPPSDLHKRKLYGFVFAAGISAPYLFTVEASLYLRGKPVGKFQFHTANLTGGGFSSNSKTSMVTGGSPSQMDIIKVDWGRYDSYSTAHPSYSLLSALNLEVECDEIRAKLVEYRYTTAWTGYRIYIACISSK
jgi:hypothetical protein